MRKAILTLAVAFALAGVAQALPSGPGGSIYFLEMDSVWQEQRVYYLDIDTNWDPLITTPGAVVGYATVHDDSAADSQGIRGLSSAWFNSNGKLDMAGSYHNANLLLGAYYNNTPAGTDRGQDYLSLAPDGTITILNDGVNSTSWTSTDESTVAGAGVIAVDSNFTPTGMAQGIADTGRQNTVWEDTDSDGYYDDPDNTGGYVGLQNNCGKFAYDSATGAIVGDNAQRFDASYKTASGYNAVTGYHSDGGPGFLAPIRRDVITAGDTDGDGVVNVYYSNANGIVNAQDMNNDGDWIDGLVAPGMNESIISNLPGGGWGASNFQLIETAGGWVMLEWNIDTRDAYGKANVTVYGLDSDGQYDNTSKQILACVTATTGAPSGDVSLWVRGAKNDVLFVPLGEAGVIPEPATMLLVGTGVLGLVGVVRRRFLH